MDEEHRAIRDSIEKVDTSLGKKIEDLQKQTTENTINIKWLIDNHKVIRNVLYATLASVLLEIILQLLAK